MSHRRMIAVMLLRKFNWRWMAGTVVLMLACLLSILLPFWIKGFGQ
jgi:uncharacterized membrane protein